MRTALRRAGVAVVTSLLAATGLAAPTLAHAEDTATPATGTVTGVVRADATGRPVGGVCVTLFALPDPQLWNGLWGGCTDASGTFSADVPTGRYTARFTDDAGRFAEEFYDGRITLGGATTFAVRANRSTSLNASLAPGATLTGRAVDAASGSPLAGVCASALRGWAGDYVTAVSTCTGADGRWRLTGLPAGRFALAFNLRGTSYTTWAFGASSQADATLIGVGVGRTRTVRDVALASAGTVTGRVTDAAGQPVANAWVDLTGRFPGRAGAGEGPLAVETDADGRFTKTGVEPGTYRPLVYAADYEAFAPEWAGDADSLASATPVTVTSGGQATVDFQVAPGGHLTVAVIEADGRPTTRTFIGFVRLGSGEYIGDFDIYNSSMCTSNALPGGSFVIQLQDPATGQNYWYDGATSQDDATPVTLGRGESKTITFHLP
ncbi:carboxypeptidase family protein [Terracoccus luteus]|uniref:Carboxypeptidase family protein n=1 Tax=Terracoccus luteus TaxID=53356 RepID=A0A495Y2W2_9MICO|nr:carboxypeptidase regulatory-like domain-containing protein [Terracoccus luteus]RKT79684.1 carboxypeptidase family protein [Terracoccus luteus]